VFRFRVWGLGLGLGLGWLGLFFYKKIGKTGFYPALLVLVFQTNNNETIFFHLGPKDPISKTLNTSRERCNIYYKINYCPILYIVLVSREKLSLRNILYLFANKIKSILLANRSILSVLNIFYWPIKKNIGTVLKVFNLFCVNFTFFFLQVGEATCEVPNKVLRFARGNLHRER
jgi:hypothetical protein